MHPLAQPLVEHYESIAALCHRFGVERLEVFGSAANGQFDPLRSDFDFIVRFAPEFEASIADNYIGLCDALEALLERPVDVMTDRPIANPFFRRAVDSSRRVLYVRAPEQTPA
jgi:predicted nucleotidyltransferase